MNTQGDLHCPTHLDDITY